VKERKIQDVDEIVAEYEQHFSIKMADGYSEEEIAARLGDPRALGEQFDSATNEATTGNKAIVAIGLAFVDIIVTMLRVVCPAASPQLSPLAQKHACRRRRGSLAPKYPGTPTDLCGQETAYA
jgi:hypothetical protein